MNYELWLPWPPSVLSPNNHSHWTKKAKAKAAYKEEAITCVKLGDAIPQFDSSSNIGLDITFYPPNRRKFDMDNLLASIKSGLDGVAIAWNLNDVRFRPITINMGDIMDSGGVKIIPIVKKV